jgi:phosphohistidine phosphatase SixA
MNQKQQTTGQIFYQKITLLLLGLALGFVSIAQRHAATVVYIVRHAEKVTTNPQDKDPALTPRGQARAQDLKKLLQGRGIQRIFTTSYQRTRLTAKPLAEATRVSPQFYDAPKLSALVAQIDSCYVGQSVLVVGHSNTILETIEALGGQRPQPVIDDQTYDLLWVVKKNRKGRIKVRVKHYGQPSSQQEGPQQMQGR